MMTGWIGGFTWIGASTLIAANSLSENLVSAVSLIAVAGGVAAAVFTAKTRTERNVLATQLSAAEGAAEAWKLERDAEVAKAERLAADLRAESAARVAAEARTDITRIEQQVVDNHKQMLKNHSDVIAMVGGLERILEQVAINTKP